MLYPIHSYLTPTSGIATVAIMLLTIDMNQISTLNLPVRFTSPSLLLFLTVHLSDQ